LSVLPLIETAFPDHNHPSASAHLNKRKILPEKSKERKHLLKKQRLRKTRLSFEG
jgi:hypothetical protein